MDIPRYIPLGLEPLLQVVLIVNAVANHQYVFLAALRSLPLDSPVTFFEYLSMSRKLYTYLGGTVNEVYNHGKELLDSWVLQRINPKVVRSSPNVTRNISRRAKMLHRRSMNAIGPRRTHGRTELGSICGSIGGIILLIRARKVPG